MNKKLIITLSRKNKPRPISLLPIRTTKMSRRKNGRRMVLGGRERRMDNRRGRMVSGWGMRIGRRWLDNFSSDHTGSMTSHLNGNGCDAGSDVKNH